MRMKLPKKFVDLTRKMLEMNLPKREIQEYLGKLNFTGMNFINFNSTRLESAINRTYLLGIKGPEAKLYLERTYVEEGFPNKEIIKYQKTNDYYYVPRDLIF